MKGKGNDGQGNIPERDLWETKQDFWNKLDLQYKFDFDCCASENNTKTKLFSSDFKNSIPIGNNWVCWMNPPFSQAEEMFKIFFSKVKKGVAIYRCDNMETKIWQDTIFKYASWIFIPKGRIAYTPFDVGNMRNGMGTRFPSALIGIGTKIPKNIDGVSLLVQYSSCEYEKDLEIIKRRLE
ncbi:MAG: DNA N-6-adenine-methyltransferase [bacterium]|nr:DNA N-6-adenine-methyltransferase [bacterium]